MVTRSQSGIVKLVTRLSLNTLVISPISKSHFLALKDLYWSNAMYDEFNVLVKNGTWVLVPRPLGANMVQSMWLFRYKFHANGTLSRNKARLVANGSSQQLDVDFDKIFCLVVKPATICTVLSLAMYRKWPIHQLDVNNAFFNGDYLRLCTCISLLVLLTPSILIMFVICRGFSGCLSSLYVDDIILMASTTALLQQLIGSLHSDFDMIDLGALNYFLGWDDTKEFVKLVKAIATPQSILKTPDQRLLKLEDQINFLLKGSRPAPPSSSTHNPQAYVNAAYSSTHLKNQNESPILNSFAFRKCTGPAPQPQALGTTFKARVRDYMDTHTNRIERFENTILKQRKEINGRMTKMFRLLKELTTSRTPEKVLIREEAKFPITKNVNSISLARDKKERSDKTDVTPNNTEMPTETKIPVKEAKMNNKAESEPIKMTEEEEMIEVPSSQPIEYYLKHGINEKLIEGLVDNHRFNDSLSRARAGKTKRKTYNVSPKGPVYKVILRKRKTRKEDIRGNFKIPCNIGGLKGINALVDQGSDVNVMPYTTYMKLTDERPAETNIRLLLASHLYIYPLGIAEDVLVEVAEHVYHVDFVILDIKEGEKRPFILGTPFLTTAKAIIKFDKGTINLRSGKIKISFHRIPESSCKIEKGGMNDIEHIAPIMTVNRLVLEWEERIKLHLEKEMKFNQWRSNNFKSKHPAPVKVEGGMDDEGEVTLYLMRRSLKALRKFHWMTLGGRFNQLSHVSSQLLSKPWEY
ncbi:MAK10-like protein [Tanacetum coccineum]